MKLLQAIGNFFRFWNKASIKYDSLKRDEEQRQTSGYFGRQAIIYSIIGFVFVALALWGVGATWEHLQSIEIGGTYEFPFFSLVGLIFCAVFAFLMFIKCTLYSLVLTVYQFKLNKRAIRVAALLIWFACIIGEIVVAILVI